MLKASGKRTRDALSMLTAIVTLRLFLMLLLLWTDTSSTTALLDSIPR